MRVATAALVGLMGVALCSCGLVTGSADQSYKNKQEPDSPAVQEQGSVLAGSGLDNIINGGGKKSGPQGGGGIGVNSFLWRASLDTLSFMPLASADPFGGVIITEW